MRWLVAIPVFNEEKTLSSVLKEVKRYAPHILVINDGSTDGTRRLLRDERSVYQIHHRANLGYGQSLIDAFQYAVQMGYDWLITMDCDEQHEPASIREFMADAERNEADIISGSRYLDEWPDNSSPPLDRRAINQKITDVLNELLDLNITDAFCGFKAYRTDALRRMNLSVPGYGIPLQFWVQAAFKGLRIREIPVKLIYNDPNRHFGGDLDDPDARLLYYYDVLVHALSEVMNEQGILKGQPQAGANACVGDSTIQGSALRPIC